MATATKERQLFAYRRGDGVVGFGYQIHAGNDRIHHSVAWPDRACERFSGAMIQNQNILVEPVDTPQSSLRNVPGESLEVDNDGTGDNSPGDVEQIGGEVPPVKIPADPSVTRVSGTGPNGSTPAATTNPPTGSVDPDQVAEQLTATVAQKLSATQLNPADSDATRTKVLMQAVPEATNLEIIRELNDRGIQVTDEFVDGQRAELAAAATS